MIATKPEEFYDLSYYSDLDHVNPLVSFFSANCMNLKSSLILICDVGKFSLQTE